MSKKMINRGKSLAAVCLAAVMAGGCTELPHTWEPLPEDTVEELERAYNHMDAAAMIECLDERTTRDITLGIEATMGLVGAITGIELEISGEDLISMMPMLQELVYEYSDEGYSSADFQAMETYIRGDEATVYILEAVSGDTMQANMVKEDGKWKLTFWGDTITEETADRILIAGQEEEKRSSSQEENGKLSEEQIAQLLGALLGSE